MGGLFVISSVDWTIDLPSLVLRDSRRGSTAWSASLWLSHNFSPQEATVVNALLSPQPDDLLIQLL